MKKTDYVHQDNPDQPEYERLGKLEEIFDPHSIEHLTTIGIHPNMVCLEAGPGRGGVLVWLLEKVGDKGKVVAIDLDTKFIDPLKRPNLQVIQGDLSELDLGREQFDRIHERYVLTHISGYREVLRKMVAALKPGGWILLEDADFSTARIDTDDKKLSKSFYSTIQARDRLFSGKNIDINFGSHLPDLLLEYGFIHTKNEIYSPLGRGGEGIAELVRLSTLQLWDQYLQTGAVNESDLQAFVGLAADPNQAAVYYSTVSAWGQKPPKLQI